MMDAVSGWAGWEAFPSSEIAGPTKKNQSFEAPLSPFLGLEFAREPGFPRWLSCFFFAGSDMWGATPTPPRTNHSCCFTRLQSGPPFVTRFIRRKVMSPTKWGKVPAVRGTRTGGRGLTPVRVGRE